MRVGDEVRVSADRQRQHVGNMAELQTGNDRNPDHRSHLLDHCVQIVAVVVLVRVAAGKIAELARLSEM